MDKEKIISTLTENFVDEFWYGVKHFNRGKKSGDLNVTEITSNDIRKIIAEYFKKPTLSEAEKYLDDILYEYCGGRWEDIDRQSENFRESTEYKAWSRTEDIKSVLYHCQQKLHASEDWVEVNGKAHTDEEAATIAADKWCELIFHWHLQDNGAINENHPGGFYACALGTVLANDCRERISEEAKVKAHELFKQYYLKYLHFVREYDIKDVKWLQKTLPDKDGKFEWDRNFTYIDMSCDYGPSWPLHLVLYHAGVDENYINNICPWKTTIYIRKEDNTVMYCTYQNREEL